MDEKFVRETLLKVLEIIQTRCGLPFHPLEGTSVPCKVLPKFDSTVWPAATTRLGKELGVKIPSSVHIFGGKGGKPLLTLDETVSAVCAYVQSALASVAAE